MIYKKKNCIPVITPQETEMHLVQKAVVILHIYEDFYYQAIILFSYLLQVFNSRCSVKDIAVIFFLLWLNKVQSAGAITCQKSAGKDLYLTSFCILTIKKEKKTIQMWEGWQTI